MDKQQDILVTNKQDEAKKNKLDFEGVMFYLLLLCVVVIFPIGSAFLVLNAANG